jgi:hypothetical protein
MEDTVTDFESQLRDCLSRRADTVSPPVDLAADARSRSHRLARKRTGAVVFSVVPLTAAIVFGAVSLSGSSGPARQAVNVRPATTATPSPAPTPNAALRSFAQKVCAGRGVPNLHVRAGQVPGGHESLGERSFIRLEAHRYPSDIRGFATFEKFAVDGHRPGRHTLTVELVRDKGRRLWRLVRSHANGRWNVYQAVLIGCAPAAPPLASAQRPPAR